MDANIIKAITNYQTLIATKSVANIKPLFENIDCITFSGLPATVNANSMQILYLGVENNVLKGYLISGEVDFKTWEKKDPTVYIGQFRPYTAAEKTLTYTNSISGVTGISSTDTLARMSAWSTNRNAWIDTNVAAGTLPQYFIMPNTVKSTPTGVNMLRLGIKTDATIAGNIIDIIVENPSGLADVTRPVPPFKGKF